MYMWKWRFKKQIFLLLIKEAICQEVACVREVWEFIWSETETKKKKKVNNLWNMMCKRQA